MGPSHAEIDDLFAHYGFAIDDDRLEDWLGLFTPDCRYRIVARENWEAGLRIAVVYADGRAMLEDRVAALRRANIYEPQRYRHAIGRALRDPSDAHRARASYHVARIMREGDVDLFSVGEYRIRVASADGRLLIREIDVIYDNARIDTLLALPL